MVHPLLLLGGVADRFVVRGKVDDQRAVRARRKRRLSRHRCAPQLSMRWYDDTGYMRGARNGDLCPRGWFALADDEHMTSFTMLQVCDSFPPAIVSTSRTMGWSPTVELTVHVRARRTPRMLRAQFAYRFASRGNVEEDGEIWDSSGRLVAQSRQLALVLRGWEGQLPGTSMRRSAAMIGWAFRSSLRC